MLTTIEVGILKRFGDFTKSIKRRLVVKQGSKPSRPLSKRGVCVFLCACSACTPTLLAWVCGVGVHAWARVWAAPSHSWLGRQGVCVFVCALRLYPATPSWGVWCGCVCLGPGLGCAPPLLAGVLGCVCGCVRALLVPRHSWLWFVVCGFHVAWHLSPCRGSLRVVRAARVCGTGWPLLLGTCPCALVVDGGVPLWRAWWPRFGAPRLVRSSRSRCSGWLSRRPGAVPHPQGTLLGGCAGHSEAGRELGSLCLPLAPAVAGALGSLRVLPVWGPAMGLSLAGPSGVGLGLRALR